MWRSRMRATFLSNRGEVNAENEPKITCKTGYDIYRLCVPCMAAAHTCCTLWKKIKNTNFLFGVT